MILIVGDLLVDVLLLPELRQAEQPAGIVVRPGGSAANTAAWLAAQGSAVAFAGCTGADMMGAMLTEELRARGVQMFIRRVDGMETGAVAVEIDHGAQRLMRSARGANVALTTEDIFSVGGSMAAVHLTGYALLSPPGFSLLAAAAEVATASGGLLSFDPSSPSVIAALGRERLLRELHRYSAGLLLPNRAEAAALTGTDDIVAAAQHLRGVARAVVIKDGADGCVLTDTGAPQTLPCQPVLPLDTTGAGDAFNAGVLHGLVQGETLVGACRRGHSIAAQAISVLGGRPPYGDPL